MEKHNDCIKDCITGEMLPNIGAEENRQNLLKFLLEKKGYSKESIISRYPIEFRIAGEPYSSRIDLVLKVASRLMMAIRCVAGSVASVEREIIAAARIACDGQIPLAVATDGADALVFNAIDGKPFGKGLDSIPSFEELASLSEKIHPQSLDGAKLEKMRFVFRTYDIENVNRI